MKLGIEGRVAVIAGGARGSGLVIAQRLAAEGVKVVLTGRHEAMVKAAEQSIRAAGGAAAGVVADVTAKDGPARIKAAADQAFGPPGIIVLNMAAIPSNARALMAIDEAEVYHAFETYYMTVFRMARAFLPDMAKATWGRVILLGSANMKSPSGVDPMIAQSVRVGGAALLKNLTHEYSRHNISFNTLAIGAFKTDLAKDYLKTAPPGSYEAYADRVPLKRWAEPEELAALVTFLCGDESSYVNGEVIRIDGGQTESMF